MWYVIIRFIARVDSCASLARIQAPVVPPDHWSFLGLIFRNALLYSLTSKVAESFAKSTDVPKYLSVISTLCPSLIAVASQSLNVLLSHESVLMSDCIPEVLQQQPKLAVREFQQVIDHRSLSPTYSLYLVLSQLELGHAFRLLGDSIEANRAFAEVKRAWKDADPDFPPLRELRLYREGLAISGEQSPTPSAR